MKLVDGSTTTAAAYMSGKRSVTLFFECHIRKTAISPLYISVIVQLNRVVAVLYYYARHMMCL